MNIKAIASRSLKFGLTSSRAGLRSERFDSLRHARGLSSDSGFFAKLKQTINKTIEEDEELKKTVDDLRQSKAQAEQAAKKFEENVKTASEQTAEKLKQAAGESKATSEFGDKVKSTWSKAASAAKDKADNSEFFKKASATASEAKSRADDAKQSFEEAKAKTSAAASTPRFELARNIIAGVFGYKRRSGGGVDANDYPWFQYRDPADDKIKYRNKDTGRVQELKPPDFDALASDKAYLKSNTEEAALTVVRQKTTRWDRFFVNVKDTPMIQSVLGAASEVSQSIKTSAPVQKARDKMEDAREVWETSQNPIVYNAAYAVDSLFAETQDAQALRTMLQIDSGYDDVEFLETMRDEIVPVVVRAFLQCDRAVLKLWLDQDAMEQVNAVLRAREAEQVTVDDTILSVSNVTIGGTRVLPDGTPIVVTTAMVQQIHCMKNREGKVIEGKEDEIRATYYSFAMSREYDPTITSLVWKIKEMSMLGSVLYL